MRLLLFVWRAGGHRELYLRRLVEVLEPEVGLTLAVPDPLAKSLADLDIELLPLGPPRPLVDTSNHLSRAKRATALMELELFRDAIVRARTDHALHLEADGLLRWLVRQPSLGVPTSLVLFRPRAHYPSLYRSALSPRERAAARVLELLVARWRRLPDAHALFTLDEAAAIRWSQQAGAPAYWLPEPPVLLPEALEASARSGCALYGSLAERKGVELLARAIELGPTALSVMLAGPVEPSYEAPLRLAIERMRRAGAAVELRARWHSEADGLRVLAGACCALLPYPRHHGMSRVLLEAAAVGTPVVAHEYGLVGHLVRQHGLGLAVDCADPRVLRRALLSLAESPDAGSGYGPALAHFAARFSRERFREAVSALFAPAAGVLSPAGSTSAGSAAVT